MGKCWRRFGVERKGGRKCGEWMWESVGRGLLREVEGGRCQVRGEEGCGEVWESMGRCEVSAGKCRKRCQVNVRVWGRDVGWVWGEVWGRCTKVSGLSPHFPTHFSTPRHTPTRFPTLSTFTPYTLPLIPHLPSLSSILPLHFSTLPYSPMLDPTPQTTKNFPLLPPSYSSIYP